MTATAAVAAGETAISVETGGTDINIKPIRRWLSYG